MPKKKMISMADNHSKNKIPNWFVMMKQMESDSESELEEVIIKVNDELPHTQLAPLPRVLTPSAPSFIPVSSGSAFTTIPPAPAPAPAAAPAPAPALARLSPQQEAPALREWNHTGVPSTLPYHKPNSVKWNTPRPKEDSWTSITHAAPLDAGEITYTNTIDPASVWTERVMNAFEKASSQKSELSDDFKETLGKLSFFRKPLVSKQ